MDSIQWSDIEDAYNDVSFGAIEPNVIALNPVLYNWIMKHFKSRCELQEQEIEVDDFLEWVKDVRKKAKEPRNKQLREFIEHRYGKRS
jgi:hypothetical protein